MTQSEVKDLESELVRGGSLVLSFVGGLGFGGRGVV